MKNRANIPTDEDFASAKQKMKESFEKESQLKKSILSALPKKIPCHNIRVWWSKESPTVSYIFPGNDDLERYQNVKSKDEIDNKIREVARTLGIQSISIEYHSHEHVLSKFNGNYDKYFR